MTHCIVTIKITHLAQTKNDNNCLATILSSTANFTDLHNNQSQAAPATALYYVFIENTYPWSIAADYRGCQKLFRGSIQQVNDFVTLGSVKLSIGWVAWLGRQDVRGRFVPGDHDDHGDCLIILKVFSEGPVDLGRRWQFWGAPGFRVYRPLNVSLDFQCIVNSMCPRRIHAAAAD